MMEANAVGGPSLASLPDVLTVEEAWKVLRLGRNAIYEAISRNEIRHVRLGRKILIPRAAIESPLGVAREDVSPPL